MFSQDDKVILTMVEVEAFWTSDGHHCGVVICILPFVGIGVEGVIESLSFEIVLTVVEPSGVKKHAELLDLYSGSPG